MRRETGGTADFAVQLRQFFVHWRTNLCSGRSNLIAVTGRRVRPDEGFAPLVNLAFLPGPVRFAQHSLENFACAALG
jgi:hypothetical protein